MSQSKPINLRIPGPTPLPPDVREATSRQMVNHRGAEFEALFRDVTDRFRAVLETSGDALLLTASGTGGLEACIANTVSPGDQVLSVTVGAFGDRFAEIAEAYHAQVVRLSLPWGQAAEPEAILQALHEHPDTRVLLITHNETSTGVTNDLRAIAAAVHSLGDRAPLLVVDAVSSLGGIELPMDAWGCDLVTTASQKAWMSPPGLAMVGVGPRAWEYAERATSPRVYFDYAAARRFAKENATPFTPAVSILAALQAALHRMGEEGMANVYARHHRLGAKTRQGLKALGIRLLADEAHASDTVTAAYIPEGFTASEWQGRLLREHNIVLASGQGPLKGKIFRVAHMGFVSDADIEDMLSAMAALLRAGPQAK